MIFGGGIGGLWTLAELTRSGRSCVLLESRAIGGVQTIASQGIIHGGMKYSLTGSPTEGARAISAMPDLWRSCLEGTGPIDLSRAQVLSDRQVLWTSGSLASRVAGVAASKVIRTDVNRLLADDRPEALRGAPKGVDVYAVEEPVLDPYSLVVALGEPLIGRIRLTDGEPAFTADGVRAMLVDADVGEPAMVEFISASVVLAAGGGNERLSQLAGVERQAPMQRRPLHMVMARGDLPELFGHCVGTSAGPRVTITTGHTRDVDRVWWIGGEVAETGVGRDEREQIEATRREIGACMPWVDLSGARWATVRVDRAEGATANGRRPDNAVIKKEGRTIVAWPTKLALAPVMAEQIVGLVDRSETTENLTETLAQFAPPPMAPLPWDEEGVAWT